MKKIKTAIIHWLGGVTKQELKDAKLSCFKRGFLVEATAIQCVMRDLYGLPAEEWCDAAWTYVTDEVERQNKRCHEKV